FQLDAHYRLRVSKDLADAAGMKLLQWKDPADPDPKGGLSSDLILEFITRAPGGPLAAFDIRQDATTQLGAVRDIALHANTMFVSAMDGGLLAYDVSNAGAMGASTLPLAYVSGALDDYWSAAVDHHGRVWTAAIGNTFGVMRSFRLEQFLRQQGATAPHVVSEQIAGGQVSWAPGYSASLPPSTVAVLSDRPEAIPRKIQVLVQDDEGEPLDLAAFKEVWAGLITDVQPLGGGFEQITMAIPIDGTLPYLLQRITLENLTSALRASADARPGAPAVVTLAAHTSDRLRIARNLRTYGVVSLFGYGVGILDLNALESNDAPDKPSGWKPLREKIAFTRASIEPDDSQAMEWSVAEIPDLTFTPDAAILPGNGGPNVYALDARRGILDLPVRPQPSPDGPVLGARRQSSGLVFRATLGDESYDHPRLAELRAKFEALAGRAPFGRFNGIAPHTRAIAGSPRREYVFVAGNEYGLLVVETGGQPPLAFSPNEPLGAQNLVDVIWIPGGAASVRVVPGWHVAAVTDGLGHLLLVDISRIDERFGPAGKPIAQTALFKTVSESLSAPGAYGVGKPDPRILWRSDVPVASGTLAPLVDPRTGLVYAGRLLEKRLEVIAALDPRLRVLVDLGDGVLVETGGLVPLGISQNGTAIAAPGALAAFRMEIWLPGGVAEALGGSFRVAVESERVLKALAAQTPEGWPRAHLRLMRPDGTPDPRPATEFVFTRAIPPGFEEEYRHQEGFNRFLSPWIVVIADPRASSGYAWGGATAAEKEAAGCANCERPARLAGKTEADGVWELWSGGRNIVVRPELPSATAYAYLAEARRATARIPTVIADTVRPTEVLVDANHPPIAEGMVQETVYLHSGEVETGHVDLVPGGRAGFDVLIDRTYRSRTMGRTPLGEGWTSSIFRRLRPLPNGDVE
ncbi:MAG: hypothetical protein ACRD2J_03400, partial [Thermoanaerobaculia bacterium]